MITLDKIRLTGLLRKKPWKRGFFYGDLSLRTRHGTDQAALGGFSGTARRGRPAIASIGCAGFVPPRRREASSSLGLPQGSAMALRAAIVSAARCSSSE